MSKGVERCPLCKIQVGKVVVMGPKSRERDIEAAAKYLAKLCREGKDERKKLNEVIEELRRAGAVKVEKYSDNLWKAGSVFDIFLTIPTMITLGAAPFPVGTLTGLLFSETKYIIKVASGEVCRGWPVGMWLK